MQCIQLIIVDIFNPSNLIEMKNWIKRRKSTHIGQNMLKVVVTLGQIFGQVSNSSCLQQGHFASQPEKIVTSLLQNKKLYICTL